MANRCVLLVLTAVLSIALLGRSASAEPNGGPVPNGAVSEEDAKTPSAGPARQPVQAHVQEKGSIETENSGVSPHAVNSQKRKPLLDRRWIIKMNDEKGKKFAPATPVPIAWANPEQKTRCESHLPALREAFGKTRQFSISGDSCSTARYAKTFLDRVKDCSRDCPKGYLESKGYSEQIVRNVGVLLELGRKRCLQPVSEKAVGRAESTRDRAEKRTTRRKKLQEEQKN
jgi:hypothetical protein